MGLDSLARFTASAMDATEVTASELSFVQETRIYRWVVSLSGALMF